MRRREELVAPGVLIVSGGVSLLLYVLTKEWFVQTVGHAPRLVDQESGILWHLLENVPIAIIGAGLLVWYRSRGSSIGRWDYLGFVVTGLGLASTMISHLLEHLWILLGPDSPGVFGALVWWYYTSWVVTGLGLTTLGASRAESDLLGPTGQTLVVWIVPVSVVVALGLGTTLFVSISDGFKIPIVLAIIAIGLNVRHVVGRTGPIE